MIRDLKCHIAAAVLAISLLFCPQRTAAQSPGEPVSNSAPPGFKNLQVLKEIPAQELVPTMQFVAASLGVDCSYCHVQGAFDKDDKEPKAIARKMMQMMFAINKSNFENERKVTCYSCHRGAPKPVSVPPVASEEQNDITKAIENDSPRLPSEMPDLNEILAKYMNALTGSAAGATASSRSAKGMATLPGGKRVPVEIMSKAPDKRLFIMHLANGDSITAYDGHTGWLAFPGRAPLRMSSAETEGARLDAALQFPCDFKLLFQQLKIMKLVNIGQQDAYLVLGIRSGQPPVEIYFAKDSGLLLRLVRYADSALGLNPTQIDYGDYRETGGLKIPYRWTVARPLAKFSVQIDEVQQGIAIEDEKFLETKQTSTSDDHPTSPK
jgi:hypothetical protein